MKVPTVVVNFKCYTDVVGEKGLSLARICDQVAKETGASIAIAPQMPDVGVMVNELEIPVFSQHCDANDPGGHTGRTTPEALVGIGAKGTLVNHSEYRIPMADIETVVTKCRKMGLTTIVCTNNLQVSRACCLTAPDFVAVEPPELIGGDISVTSADPGIVSNTVKAIIELDPGVKILTGAGVKNGEDVKKAIELGTHGVLLASGLVKAKDPRKTLLDLVSGLPE